MTRFHCDQRFSSKKPPSEPFAQFTFRLPLSMKQQLERQAAQQKISLAQLVINLLSRVLSEDHQCPS